MSRPVVSALIVLTLAPATALAGGDERRTRRADFDFVVALPAADVPTELREALDLPGDGRAVIVAPVPSGERTADFAVRYDAQWSDLDTLAGFTELWLIDPELRQGVIPVVMTDLVAAEDVADSVAPGLDPAALRSVISADLLDDAAQALFPSSFEAADAWAAVWEAGAVATVGIPEVPDARFVVPESMAPEILDDATPWPGESSWMGLLCVGPQTADAVCEVASTPTTGGGSGAGSLWVDWLVGGGDRYPATPEESDDADVDSDGPEGLGDSSGTPAR